MANYFRMSVGGGSGEGAEFLITITCNDFFAGQNISIVKEDEPTVAIDTQRCPIDAPYEVTLKVTEGGNYKAWSVVDGENYYSKEAIEVIAEYEGELKASLGFNLAEWLSLAGITTSYDSLADVSEADMRKAMTMHASSDYLAEYKDEDTINMFTTNAKAMKWLGLRDYICDKLMAINEWKTAMLASDNWEYILKDHVPVMTSNNVPYGECFGANTIGYEKLLYQVFDNNNSTVVGTSDGYLEIGYKFVNPICVKKLTITNRTSSTPKSIKNFKVVASNDNFASDIHELGTFENNDISASANTFELNNNNYYLYYKIVQISRHSSDTFTYFSILQFYGRSLNVCVPTMTSNTEPYGECMGSTAKSGNELWRTFDDQIATFSATEASQTSAWVGYKFANLVNVRKIKLYVEHGATTDVSIQVSYSDNGSDWDIAKVFTSIEINKDNYIDIDDNGSHLYWKIDKTMSPSRAGICNELQFYGLDYSERDFAEDSKIEYIYDHGVELIQIDTLDAKNGGKAEKKDDFIKFIASSSNYGSGYISTTNPIDFNTNYKTIICKFDLLKYSTSDTARLGMIIKDKKENNLSNPISYTDTSLNTKLKELIFVLGSVIESHYLILHSYLGDVNMTELWLEKK